MPVSRQDYGPSGHHGTAFLSPTFYGSFAEFSSGSYIQMPSSFANALSSVTSYAFSTWVKPKVGPFFVFFFFPAARSTAEVAPLPTSFNDCC